MAGIWTRRQMLYGAAATGLIPFAEWFDVYGRAEAATPVVRRNVASAGGAAMLTAYRKAVTTMMARGLGEPCGWTFQWYTHAVRSDRTKAGEVGTLPVAQRPLANAMWDTCQAHAGRPLQYFLPWHRMYVYFLERMVRKASGDPNFALPYWDYMNPAQRALPAAFRTDPASALYRVKRNTGSGGTANVNGGQPIDANQPAGTLNLAAMTQPTYGASANGPGFNSVINGNPHRLVHGMIGNATGMGSVPWAADDPIFWLHHCNIDRLWASWNGGHANPADPAWRNQQFVFADEDCNRVLVKVADFEKLAPLGYTYDTMLRSPRPDFVADLSRIRQIAVVRPQFPRPGPGAGPGPGPGPVRIPLGRERVVLPLTPVGEVPLVKTLRVNPAQRLQLTVADLRATLAPGVLYHLYLNLPDGESPRRATSRYIGAITFFDAVPMTHAGHDDRAGAGEGPSFWFDVTDLVRRLDGPAALAVTIVPAGQADADAMPSIGRIELAVAE